MNSVIQSLIRILETVRDSRPAAPEQSRARAFPLLFTRWQSGCH